MSTATCGKLLQFQIATKFDVAAFDTFIISTIIRAQFDTISTKKAYTEPTRCPRIFLVTLYK